MKVVFIPPFIFKEKEELIMNIKVELPVFPTKRFNVLDFGAVSEIDFNNQEAFQKAIDACHQAGGGVVVIPNGFYLTGPIELKSNVCLHLEDNALVEFTKSKEEYPLEWTDYEGQKRIRAISPIRAVNQQNIGITGNGILDGSGHLWRGIKEFKLTKKEWARCLEKSPYTKQGKEGAIWFPTKTALDGFNAGEPAEKDEDALEKASLFYDHYRPVFVSLKNCNKILIEGVTLQNSPAWNIHPWFCTNLTVRNAKVRNKYSAQNGDGIDIESCRFCEIAHTIFEVGDDGICIKSGKNKEAREISGPCEDIWIHDCKVFDAHGGFVVGSEMSRGVRNIVVENCSFIGTDIGIRFKSAIGRGGVVENITIKNISMIHILEEAIIFTMGYALFNYDQLDEANQEKLTEEDYPIFQNISMSHIVCDEAKTAIHILGLQKSLIHNLSFHHVQIKAQKTLKLAYCEDIVFSNTRLISPDENLVLDQVVMDGSNEKYH